VSRNFRQAVFCQLVLWAAVEVLDIAGHGLPACCRHAAVQLKGILCATCLLQGSNTMYEMSSGNRTWCVYSVEGVRAYCCRQLLLLRGGRALVCALYGCPTCVQCAAERYMVRLSCCVYGVVLLSLPLCGNTAHRRPKSDKVVAAAVVGGIQGSGLSSRLCGIGTSCVTYAEVADVMLKGSAGVQSRLHGKLDASCYLLAGVAHCDFAVHYITLRMLDSLRGASRLLALHMARSHWDGIADGVQTF
jgi:hypothetical protein